MKIAFADLFKAWRALMTADKPDGAKIDMAIADAERAAARAAAEIARLTAQRRSVLVLGSDPELSAHDEATARESREYDRASAMIAELKARLATIAEAERLAAIEAGCKKAERLATEAAARLAADYGAAVSTVLGLLKATAEADLAVSAWNTSNPEKPPIALTEARVRRAESIADKVLSERRTWAWRTPNGGIVDEMYNGTVRRQVPVRESDGVKTTVMRDVGHPNENLIDLMNAGTYLPGGDWIFYSPQVGHVLPVQCMRREIERADRLPMPDGLAAKIVLPALRPGDPFWVPAPDARFGPNPSETLTTIDRPPPATMHRFRIVIVEPVVDVALAEAAA